MKYKIKVNPLTVGDFEMEWLSPEEQKIRWNKVKDNIKNNVQPYMLDLEVESCPILDISSQIPTTSYKMIIID